MKNSPLKSKKNLKLVFGVLISCLAMTQAMQVEASPVGNVYMQSFGAAYQLKGDVTTPLQFAGAVNLLSFMQSSTRDTQYTASGGLQAGKITCGQLSVSKNIDSASTALLLNEVSAKLIPEILITIMSTPVGTNLPYSLYTISMKNVAINGINQVETSGNIVENVTLFAQSYTYTYTPTLPNGTPGQKVTAGYNCYTGQVL
jgi:type VI protein secretion system component Hcp